MAHTLIITPVARYLSATTDLNALAGYAKLHPDHRVEMWNDKFELVFSSGDITMLPEIWTSQPIPTGLDIVSLKEQFEARAASILSDYEESVDFSPDSSYPDGRYKDLEVRAAWMMYVDLAIMNFGQAR